MSALSRETAQPHKLVDLARRDAPPERAELYDRVARLFEAAGRTANDNERGLLVEIMRVLSMQVDLNLRLGLAQRLADRPDVDHELILMLAHDEITVAAPIIARSPVLTEADLVEVIRLCSIDHRTAVACRPEITEPVSDALIDTAVPDVLRALAGNDSAAVSVHALERLADATRTDGKLLAMLLHRRGLPKQIAIRMYAWASAALRQHILQNFDIDPEVLDRELAQAVSNELTKTLEDPRTKRLTDLVEKLSLSGQLKVGFVLKALRDDQLDLFRLAFAKLADIEPEQMSRILAGSDLDAIALATRAIGIDRSVFPTVVRKLHGQARLDAVTAEERLALAATLAIDTPEDARRRLTAKLHH
jgi:uncharacterized protein (DUF2336 family)